MTQSRLSPPDDEKLRRCAWVKDTASILPLFRAAKDHLADIDITWDSADPFPATVEEPGSFSGHDLRRWILSVRAGDTDAVEKLKRFTVSCADRFGEIGHAHFQESLSAHNVSQPQPPEWICEFAWKVHLLIGVDSLARFREMVKEWKRDRDQSHQDKPRDGVGEDRNVDGPPPLFLGPTLTIPARYTVLAALHDWCLSELEERCGETLEPIDPWHEDTCENTLQGMPFAVLQVDRLPELECEKHSDFIADCLSTVERDLAVRRRTDNDASTKDGRKRMKDFFISYNGNDKQWAEWIAWKLEEAGYTTVIQAWDFRAGGDFVMEMQKAATGTERTIAVLSDNYLNADYTQPEWGNAFARDPKGEERTLIPVRIANCKPGGLLATRIYIDLVGLSEDDARSKLIESLKERAKPETSPAFPGSSDMPEPATEHPPQSFPGHASSAVEVWQEKLEFLRVQEPRAVSTDEKFAIKKGIEEAEQKIREFGGTP